MWPLCIFPLICSGLSGNPQLSGLIFLLIFAENFGLSPKKELIKLHLTGYLRIKAYAYDKIGFSVYN